MANVTTAVHRFAGKRLATSWLKSQGFQRQRGPHPGRGEGWTCDGQQARWVQIPGEEPAGVVVVSRRWV